MEHQSDDWKDTHSVTCAVCGDLADERETIKITKDMEAVGPATYHENPGFIATLYTIIARHGEGEAHQNCFDDINAEIVEQ